ncbi:MAG: electron transfer flavoprotein [Spirochaetes bacterium RBG_13_51_14]|nr:MAG: electron transfer flavoprotein [Spirochaetes bacterium RBG_13_51_14]
MIQEKFSRTSVLVVGAGPAGLACAISAKRKDPQLEICVIDKGSDPGNHNLSGAVLEPDAARGLIDVLKENWQDDELFIDVFNRAVERDDILFFLGKKCKLNIGPLIRFAGMCKLPIGNMRHDGDYIVSISRLAKLLGREARRLGIEVLFGFPAEDIILSDDGSKAMGVKLVDQGLDKEGNKQPNYSAGEIIEADVIVLAEGCDGLVTERFIEKALLKRKTNQLYSIGVKEVIKVSEEQYERFGDNRVVHALGYPVWTPVLGPGMFGGGLMYSYGDNCIAVGMIVGLDWKEFDFNPQDALTHFKNHPFVNQFINDGKVIETGAKMIPEGGFYAIPRDSETNSIGKGNVIIIGDGAGLVNMLKIKGLHNAIHSGLIAGEVIAETIKVPVTAAQRFTEIIDHSITMKEMKQAGTFRQTIAKFGNMAGFPLSVFGGLLPLFRTEPDYRTMRKKKYKYKGNREFDKDTFTALAHTEHREDQPSHLTILDSNICSTKCKPVFREPCITFCPAGVYENIMGVLKPANPSNCLHCKTCQRKCPFDNIRWTVPEGGGGPRYTLM